MLDNLVFRLRVLLQGEDFIESCSAPQADLMRDLDGKSVAVVGNARSLSHGEHGTAIDDHDLVIRMHRAPLPDARSHGIRTDWLALGMPVPDELISERGPTRVLWMAKKRKRLTRSLATQPGFYRHPIDDWQALAQELGAPPSTGAMVTDLVQRSDASRIGLFGFDFFASLSMSGSRTAAQVPHDFAAEAARAHRLIETDPRLVLIRTKD